MIPIAWVTPKTNWTEASFFNPVDYNRIKNNINELASMINQVYRPITISNMGSDKTYSDYIYADEFNLFETNLDAMKNWIVNLGISDGVLYSPNAPTFNYTELNRIESAMLLMYTNLLGQISGRPTLAFTLNGGIFE